MRQPRREHGAHNHRRNRTQQQITEQAKVDVANQQMPQPGKYRQRYRMCWAIDVSPSTGYK